MTTKELIIELLNRLNKNGDTEVTVHAANGTKLLNIESVEDYKSARVVGDTNEPRMTLICYRSEAPATIMPNDQGLPTGWGKGDSRMKPKLNRPTLLAAARG